MLALAFVSSLSSTLASAFRVLGCTRVRALSFLLASIIRFRGVFVDHFLVISRRVLLLSIT